MLEVIEEEEPSNPQQLGAEIFGALVVNDFKPPFMVSLLHDLSPWAHNHHQHLGSYYQGGQFTTEKIDGGNVEGIHTLMEYEPSEALVVKLRRSYKKGGLPFLGKQAYKGSHDELIQYFPRLFQVLVCYLTIFNEDTIKVSNPNQDMFVIAF